MSDFNAELHARPSIYFEGPAFLEHIAFLCDPWPGHDGGEFNDITGDAGDTTVRIERHAEFLTVTRLVRLEEEPLEWPRATLSEEQYANLAGLVAPTLVCRIAVLVVAEAPRELGPAISSFGFGDATASSIGGGSAQVCSDFRVRGDKSSRIILFNRDLNAHRLGRMVRRLLEIETYRSMALLGLPEARRLTPLLGDFDSRLVRLANRHLDTSVAEHRTLLDEITSLSAQIISATAETRNRFGATSAYATIVEDRISLLRETHVPGFQRYGTFVARRFRPAVRTCEATAKRLEQLSHATTHLVDLLQTRIQVEIELQNTVQIKAMAERAATQVRIQRAVEGFSVIAISYYLLAMLKVTLEAADHAGIHVSPLVLLVSIPIVVSGICLTVLRVRHALETQS